MKYFKAGDLVRIISQDTWGKITSDQRFFYAVELVQGTKRTSLISDNDLELCITLTPEEIAVGIEYDIL